MSTPLVSIIIPTFNRAKLIGETLDSILDQSYSHWECIVVDDGSSDDSISLIQSYVDKDDRFKSYLRPTNRQKGANACRNFGFEQSKGSLINWFDSDDLMAPQKLAKQVEVMVASDTSFTVCQTEVFEGNRENSLGLRKPQIYAEDFFNAFVTNEIKWLTQAPMFRRSFLEEHNLKFDETLAKAQERDFFVKVLDKTTAYHHDNTPLVFFRKHDESISYGKVSEEKIRSTFRVNQRIIQDHLEKLTPESISYLKHKLKSEIKKSVHLKSYGLATDLWTKLSDLDVMTLTEKAKVKLGMFLLRHLQVGDRLLK